MVVCGLQSRLSFVSVSMLFLDFDSTVFNSFVDFCPWFQFYGVFSPTCFFLFFKSIYLYYYAEFVLID